MVDKQTLVQHLAELAKEVSSSDHFEFPFGLDKDATYLQVSEAVLTNYLETTPENRDEVMLAALIHTTIENLVLNYRLLFNGED